MPVEGPLREFGIQDVFQLLDMSRKTGMLRVTNPVRNDEAHVFFEAGKIVHAGLKSQASSPEELLVEAGKITQEELEHARKLVSDHKNGASLSSIFIDAGVVSERELERMVRTQLETVVFDLMSWREGFFSFEERSIAEIPKEARVSVATESLLMESARRIDEWGRIADKVPNLTVIPALAPVPDDHESQLDLLPHEWEVLTMIDGVRDLRAMAAELNRDEFDVAKVVYGLATTGVVEIRQRRLSTTIPVATPAEDPAVSLELGFACVRAGDLRGARTLLEKFLQLAPHHAAAPRVKSALDAIAKLLNAMEA